MNIKYLPLSERLKVACYHSSGSRHSLWQLDMDSGHMVCFLCGKPAPPLVLRICPTCYIQFVLPFGHERWVAPKFIWPNGEVVDTHVECDTCY